MGDYHDVTRPMAGNFDSWTEREQRLAPEQKIVDNASITMIMMLSIIDILYLVFFGCRSSPRYSIDDRLLSCLMVSLLDVIMPLYHHASPSKQFLCRFPSSRPGLVTNKIFMWTI